MEFAFMLGAFVFGLGVLIGAAIVTSSHKNRNTNTN